MTTLMLFPNATRLIVPTCQVAGFPPSSVSWLFQSRKGISHIEFTQLPISTALILWLLMFLLVNIISLVTLGKEPAWW